VTGKTIIKVKGHLDKKWEDSFEDIKIGYEGINTILKITIKDEPHLHGILNLIRDLNLILISVNSSE
jgi:hypothetical protein